MKGYKTHGYLYPKKHFTNVINNDEEQTIAAVMLPPYVYATKYWLAVSAVANSQTAVQLSQYIKYYGRYFAISPNYDADADSDPIALANEYAPIVDTEFADTDTNTGEADIPGHDEGGDTWKAFKVFERERWLRLGNGAVLSGDNEMTYMDTFDTSGNLRGRCGRKPEEPALLIFTCRVDEPVIATDWAYALTGHASTLQELTDQAIAVFGDPMVGFEGMTESTVGPGVPAGDTNRISEWLQKGHAEGSTIVADAQMNIQARLTLATEVLTPNANRHVSGG